MEKNNKIMTFKTNINCGGCVNSIKSHLDKVEEISHWEVDTNDTNKILTISSKGITEQEVIDIIKKAGYNIELFINE